MKTILLSLVALSAGFLSCSQDIPANQVPSVVQNTFQSKFPNPTDVEWEKKDGFYEVEFDVNKIDHKAHIDPAGKMIMFKMEIRKDELPAAVATVVSQEYKDYDIDDADKLEKDGTTYYQVELDAKGKEDKLLVFTLDGKLAENINYMH